MAAFKELSSPDLDYFVGSSWNTWEKAVKKEGFSKKNTENEGFSQSTEVARLKRQDFELFGICPGKDDFYLVVCKQCRLPFKPQAFQYHVERHHKQNMLTWPAETKQKRSQSKKFSCVVSGLPKSQLSTTKVLNNSGFNLKPTTNKPDKKIEKICVQPTATKTSNNNGSAAINSHSPIKNLQIGLNSTVLDKNSSSFKNNFPVTDFPNIKLPFKRESSTQIKHSNLSTKTFSKKADQIYKHNHFNKSLGRLHPNKNLKRKSTSENSEIKTKKEFTLSDGDKTPNGPIVMVEKSPSVKNLYEDFLKDTKSTTAQQHFRKHHNDPEIKVIKASDRNFTTAQKKKIKKEGMKKKILPLKPREYNPNKHCGVWIEDEQMRCTRSLTCKSHSRSIKRTVPDRRKPFDELVIDHAIAKQKLKEKTALLSDKQKYSASDSSQQKNSSMNKSERAVMSPPLAPSKLSQKSRSSDSKLKCNINLFTRNLQAKYVGCCEDNENTTEANFDPRLDYLSHYPKPISVCNFRSSQLDQRSWLFSFQGNQSRRRISKSFSVEKTSYKLQKHKHFPITNLSATSLTRFVSVPSASRVVMETQAGVLPKNDTFSDITSPDLIPSYANKNYVKQRGCSVGHIDVTTTPPEGHLAGAKANTVPNKLFKSGGRVMTQKYATVAVQTVMTSNTTDSGCIFVSSPQFNNVSSTSDSTAIDLNSLLLKGDQVIQLNQSVLKGKESLMFKNPNNGLNFAAINIFSGHTPKLKKSLRPKKNHMNDSLNQQFGGKHLNNKVKKSAFRNQPQTNNKNLQRVNSEPLMQTTMSNKSLNRTNSMEGSQASISHKPIKHDPVNGLSSSILCSKSWPQSVTLSGGIGALRPNNNSEQNESFNLNNKGFNKHQHVSQNCNKNNNLELPNNVVTMDNLQSFLVMDNNALFNENSNLADTGEPLTDDKNYKNAPDTVNHCDGLNYLSLTPNEFSSLLDVGQGINLPISASQDLILDEALIFNNDPIVKLRNS